MESKQLHSIIGIWTNACRFLLAAVFIFSGFVKAVDPLGTQYKIQDYLEVFGWAASVPAFLPFLASVLQAMVEFCLGVYLLFGIRRRMTTLFVVLIMGVMTPLTLWLALSNPISDCGCFGDAVTLTNWETFGKNVLLLIAAVSVFKWGNRITPLVTKRFDWLVAMYTFLYISGMTLYCYRVALGTGLRSGELRGLTWSDIDFRKREISINKTLVYIKDMETKKYVFKYQTPKTKNSIRTIPMQESVYKALKRQKIQLKEMQLMCEEWKNLEGFEHLVFLGKNGKPISERAFQVTLDGIEKAINKERECIAKKNKTSFEPIPHFYPHALRHTFATRCFEAGIEAKVVQGFLGHYSIAITLDLYTHVTDDKAKSEMDKLQNLYQEII